MEKSECRVCRLRVSETLTMNHGADKFRSRSLVTRQIHQTDLQAVWRPRPAAGTRQLLHIRFREQIQRERIQPRLIHNRRRNLRKVRSTAVFRDGRGQFRRRPAVSDCFRVDVGRSDAGLKQPAFSITRASICHQTGCGCSPVVVQICFHCAGGKYVAGFGWVQEGGPGRARCSLCLSPTAFSWHS